MLVSCGNSDQLKVRQFHLRNTDVADEEAALVRGEQLYRLRGAVTLEQRQNRLGNYYTIYWNTPHASQEGMKVVFEYQQAMTASKVLSLAHSIPAGQARGTVEFPITGKAYRKGGAVLAWRARLMKGGQTLAVKRSYLWR